MATRVLGVISTLVMARILLPADFGVLAMASTFAAAIETFSQLGLQEALIRRREDDERLHDTAFTLQFGRAVLTGFAIAAVAPAASDWFGEPRLTPILFVLSMATAVAGLRNIGVVAFRREMNYRQQFVLLSVPRLVQVAITIPLGLTLRSYWALVAGICISKVAEVAMSYLAHPYRPRLSLLGWRELASFSIWTWAASIASLLWNRCDPFVIGPAVGPAALGVYLLAAEIASLPVTELVAPATEVLYSGFSMAQKGGSDPLATALPASTILLLIVMPLTIAISATSGYIVAATLGPRWTDAQPLIAIAAWLGLFAPYSYVCATALVSAGRVRTIFVINSIASLLKLAGLSAVVAMTTDLPIIAAAGVAIVGSETLLFFVAIIRGDGPPVRDTLAGVARILVSTAVTFAAVAATGRAWSRVDMPAVQALAIGAALGIGAIAVFVASSFCVWHVSGRPAGPETRVVELLARMARPLRDRLAAAF